jgi:hypothetical protein
MRLIIGIISLLFIAVAGVALAYPAAAAVACPSCYGFTSLGGNLYVEKTMPHAERQQAQDYVDKARKSVAAFYGGLEGNPRILVCATAGCYGKMGGGSRGMAMFDMALILAPAGDNPVIAAHELSHIELHSRIGRINTFEKVVPQWFDEGLAVVVSGDPRYLKPEGAADRCTAEPIADLPASRGGWVASVERDNLYPKAACRVLRWMNARGGPSAIGRLADAIAKGEDFATATR